MISQIRIIRCILTSTLDTLREGAYGSRMSKRHVITPDSVESLLVRLEELVLANSGEDEFEEIFKLLISKLWDERSGKERRFRATDDARLTLLQVNSLLAEAKRVWPGIIGQDDSIRLSPEHLTTCVRVLQRFNLVGAGVEALHASFEFLTARASKGAKGQFFTPRYVVEFCVRMVNPSASETVLDPACGSGAFLFHAFNWLSESKHLDSDEKASSYLRNNLWGFDFDLRAVRIAKALMLIADGDSANIIRLNSLLKPEAVGSLFSQVSADQDGGDLFLTVEDVVRSRVKKSRGFDVIMTNPPFAGEIRDAGVLEGYTLAKGERVERDILFLERCIELLKPGGRLAIVLPHNKLAGVQFAYVRNWLLKHARVVAVVGLGRNTFLPHTHQKTSVLFAERRRERKTRIGEERIFFGVSEQDGKDSHGNTVFRARPESSGSTGLWENVDHDLEGVLSAFQQFAAEEGLAWGEA